MDFNIFYQFKNKESMWTDYLFYFISMVLIASIFFYVILVFKINLDTQRIAELQTRIAGHSTEQEKTYETKFANYKKQITDFSVIIQNHKISSGIFVFVEDQTLPTVWFSNFDLSASVSQIKLSGEADSLETVGRQVQIFEKNEYVKSIDVLHTEIQPTGKVTFLLNLALDPKVFNYANNPLWK